MVEMPLKSCKAQRQPRFEESTSRVRLDAATWAALADAEPQPLALGVGCATPSYTLDVRVRRSKLIMIRSAVNSIEQE
jgi:hypothetical protein